MKTVLVAIFLAVPIYAFSQDKIVTSELASLEKEVAKKLVETTVASNPKETPDALPKGASSLNKYYLDQQRKECKIRYENFKASIVLVKQISGLIRHVESDKGLLNSSAIMQKVNSPTSDILGFRFVDVVNNQVESIIDKAYSGNSDKDRVKNVFKNLITNLSSSFPIVGIIQSVVTSFTTMVKPDIIETKVKNTDGVKMAIQSYSKTNEAFKQNEITEFLSNIKPFIEYYSRLEKESTTLENSLNEHTIKYEDFRNTLKVMEEEFKTRFGSDLSKFSDSQTNMLFKYEDLLKPNDNVTLDNYSTFFESTGFLNSQTFVMSVVDMMPELTKYVSDHKITIESNYNNNKLYLEGAKNLKGADSGKITSTINQLTDNFSGTNGYKYKYDSDLNSIKTSFKGITRSY